MLPSNVLDAFIGEVDNALRTLLPPQKRISMRCSPAEHIADKALSLVEKKHIAGLMRVNHAGEVCAQALYQGQALTAQLSYIKQQMNEAAAEEIDHLAWCEKRLHELDAKTSILNPLWYSGSLIIGALAGLAGDKISLGFVAETERQVTTHLKHHLEMIPQKDEKTRAILEKMHEDEQYHASIALKAGAMELPTPVKRFMSIVSKLMTKSSYHL